MAALYVLYLVKPSGFGIAILFETRVTRLAVDLLAGRGLRLFVNAFIDLIAALRPFLQAFFTKAVLKLVRLHLSGAASCKVTSGSELGFGPPTLRAHGH